MDVSLAAHVVHNDDIGVVQRGCGACLAQKALYQLCVPGQLGR